MTQFRPAKKLVRLRYKGMRRDEYCEDVSDALVLLLRDITYYKNILSYSDYCKLEDMIEDRLKSLSGVL